MEPRAVDVNTGPGDAKLPAVPTDELKVIADTRFARLVERNNWVFVSRNRCTGVVAAAVLTPQHELVLVEQYREPVAARVLELPAGLVGDQKSDEDGLVAALRELREETGYEAKGLKLISSRVSSAGITDESTNIYFAENVVQVGPGGGVDGENIVRHLVPLNNIEGFIAEREAAGVKICARIDTAVNWIRRNVRAVN